MPACPSCGLPNAVGAATCRVCGASMAPSIGEVDAEWVEVFRGHGTALRAVEEELGRLGVTAVRDAGTSLADAPFEVGVLGAFEATDYALLVRAEEYAARQAEIEAVVQEFTGEDAGDLAAQAEAEQDYDVRACPSCLRYYHDNRTTCPGCGVELVPAVECFAAGQLEPDWVVVRAGPAADAEAVASSLRAAGFDARVEAPAGWAVSLVELPWASLIDRTAEAEAILQAVPPAAPPL